MNQPLVIQNDGWLGSSSPIPEIRESASDISIKINDQVVTLVEERETHSVRGTFRAPAYILALWFLENWWRLRWEPDVSGSVEPSVDWRLAHEMSSAGNGIAWPPICIASTGDSISFSMPDRQRVNSRFAPIRYLERISDEVSSEAFEHAVDNFVAVVLGRLESRGIRTSNLHDLNTIIRKERNDALLKRIRRREALLGYDRGEAPNEDIELLEAHAERFGSAAVDEIAPMGSTARTVKRSLREMFDDLEQVSGSALAIDAVPKAHAMLKRYQQVALAFRKPWELGFVAAQIARREWSIGNEPLLSPALMRRLGASEDAITSAPTAASIAFGVRDQSDRLRVAFRVAPHLEKMRRFELARMIGDNIFISVSDSWRPVTPLRTSRQQFQRAFAAEWLCPGSALTERFGSRGPETDDEIAEVAEDFGVDTGLVRRQVENGPRIALVQQVLESERGLRT